MRTALKNNLKLVIEAVKQNKNALYFSSPKILSNVTDRLKSSIENVDKYQLLSILVNLYK